MARIVIDARQFTTSTGRYTHRLIDNLQDIDQKNEYVILLTPKDAAHWQPKAKNFRVIATKYKEFSLGEQLGFTWQLYGLRADLVHFGMTQQPILYLKRSVTTIHDLTAMRFRNPAMARWVYMIKQPVYKAIIWFAAHKNVFIFTPTEYVRDDVARFARVSKDKIVATLESADVFPDKPEPIDTLAGKDFIMYVGRPQPHKNLARLIEAFAILKKTHPKLLLVLAGKKDAMYDSFIKTAQDYGVGNDVVFTGFIADSQLKWAFQNCKAYVFPSLSEGFGLPGLEAMAHGAPVACSNASCLPEVYQDAVHYFNPLDVNDMAQCIDTIISSKTVQADLKKRGIAHAATFSWSRTAKQTLAVYQKALS